MNTISITICVVLFAFMGFLVTMKFLAGDRMAKGVQCDYREISKDKEELIRLAYLKGFIDGCNAAKKKLVSNFTQKDVEVLTGIQYSNLKKEIKKIGYYFSYRDDDSIVLSEAK